MKLKRRLSWLQIRRSPPGVYPAVLLLSFITMYMRYTNISRIIKQNEIKANASPRLDVRVKNIVWYELYHGGLRMDSRTVDMNKCEYKNCKINFIDNRQHYHDQFATADAVIFQGGRLPKTPPKRASDNQVYIFASIESPIHLQVSRGVNFDSWRNTVNWTMTYRLDSDILYKYGVVVPKLNVSKDDAEKNYSEIFRNKTKEVAWLVSDCRTESMREIYVKMLKKYISVDVYGKCGKFKNCTKEEGIKCMSTITNDYKFYLSFENSICTDYMTEKVFFWFQKDIITVVRGARSYDKLLPPKTHITTSKFTSIYKLGKYLKQLSQDETSYTEYLQQKSQYTTVSARVQIQNAYCQVCKRLHNLDSYKKTYDSIQKWWAKDACTRSIKDLH